MDLLVQLASSFRGKFCGKNAYLWPSRETNTSVTNAQNVYTYTLNHAFWFGDQTAPVKLKEASLMYVADTVSGIGSHQSVINVKKRSASGTIVTTPPHHHSTKPTKN